MCNTIGSPKRYGIFFGTPINLSISAVKEENALILDAAQDVMRFLLVQQETLLAFD